MDNLSLFDPEPTELPPSYSRLATHGRPQVLGKDVFHAQLTQQEPATGLRGWKIYVTLPGRVSDWPERVWSRQAAGRPPLIADRIKALAELGFELAGENGREPGAYVPHELWTWQESTTLDGRVSLFASAYVRRIGTGPTVVPGTVRCQCGSARVDQERGMRPPYALNFRCADCDERWEDRFPARGGHDVLCAYVAGMGPRCTCGRPEGVSRV